MGDFFKRLDSMFRHYDATTYKIGFNAGDEFFSNKDNYTAYKGKKEEFASFIEKFLKERKIDKIFLFGDCRYYQARAIFIAKQLKVDVFVFEEGYIRPDYITMERYGVNDFSNVPRERDFYDNLPLKEEPKADNTYNSPVKMVLSAAIYYFLGNVFHYRYPHYEHHRDFSAMKEFFYGVRSVVRKQLYKFEERDYLQMVKNELAKNYFFVPLQTHNDFQILQHSSYQSVEKFIIEVIESYAKSGVKAKLIFKHHPVDRGRKDYKTFILDQAYIMGVEDRVLVMYDTHLPTLLKNAIGTITINSTVGLSSLQHNTPTLTLGNAIYDIEGLTSKGLSLEQFWHKQQRVDRKLLQKFRTYIIKNTQLNGSFYGKLPDFELGEA
jgi:capsular polysaccharide export protein